MLKIMRIKDSLSATFFRTSVLAVSAGIALSVTACGGSDGPDVRLTVDGPLSVAEAVGSYKTECVASGAAGASFKIVEGTFTSLDNGSGKAVVHYQAFGQDPSCKPASLAYDFTATFDVTPRGQTKGIATKINDVPVTETASTADATLRSLVVSKGSFKTALPVPGIATKVGYFLNKPNLRFLAGHRETDGLGGYISPLVLKKVQ